MILNRILMASIMAIAFLGCQSGETRTVPDDLVGVWNTSASKYKDRFMEFKKDVVIFGTGEGEQSIHPIRKIEAVRQDKESLFTIYYLGREGGEYSFSFFYDPGYGVIIFKNQTDIRWEKHPQ